MKRTNVRMMDKKMAVKFIIEKLATKKYYIHHTSMKAGYVPSGKVHIADYNGHFGKGYTMEFSDWRKSTRYSFITYIIENWKNYDK